MLLTVKEVSEVLKTNVTYVHRLRKSGLLPFLKLGSYKCREEALHEFLERYENHDLTDPDNIKSLVESKGNEYRPDKPDGMATAECVASKEEERPSKEAQ